MIRICGQIAARRSTIVTNLTTLTLGISFEKPVLARMASVIASGHANGQGMVKTVNSPPVIATHNGVFHADDVLACFLLKTLPEFKDATIVRTRDGAVIDKADIVVDVGAIYDPERNRFDHHQKTFTDTLDSLRPGKNFPSIKLSSAGLVYHHFGHRIISELLGLGNDGGDTSNLVDIVFEKVYYQFVQEIDAIDNGVNICDNPKYDIHTNLSSRVGHMKPQWNDESNDEILLERFQNAMVMAGSEFSQRVHYYGKSWWPARKYVKQALNRRSEVDESGEIMDLTLAECEKSYPWAEHLYALEIELNISGLIKFVIFADQYGKWRVQAVPLTANSFDNRIPLHKEWRGLRDSELSATSGILGSIFVHTSGFIGGNETRQGALDMARKSIKFALASS